MNIRRYTFSQETAYKVAILGTHLYTFYKYGSVIRFTDANALNPTTIYYGAQISISDINSVRVDTVRNEIYLAVSSTNYVGVKIKNNSLYYIAKPLSITEDSVDVAFDDSYVYFLMPGETSATNAKVLQYERAETPIINQTFSLIQSGDVIRDARTMAIDNDTFPDGHIWVATYEDPIKLVKITMTDPTGFSFESSTLT